MQCPSCGVEDVIEIHHKLPDGTKVDFFSCHRCDERWWDREGQSIDLAEVLRLVREPPTPP